MAQPPLSRRIQELEAELQVILIDRSARPMALTPAGKLVNEQALDMLARMDKMQAVIKRFRNSAVRTLVIGFVPSILYTGLPELVRTFRKMVPEVDLSLVELSSSEQIVALKDSRIDLGFGRLRLEAAGVQRVVLFQEPLVAAIPETHVLGQTAEPVSLGELVEETLIVYLRNTLAGFVDPIISLFHDHGLDPRTIQQVGELQTAIGLVAAENGVAIVPKSVERLRSDDVHYRPIRDSGATIPIIMSYRQDARSEEFRTFMQVLQDQYEKMGHTLPSVIHEARH